MSFQTGPRTLADVIADERARVTAGAPGCTHTCGPCHAPNGQHLACQRIADHHTTAASHRDVHVGEHDGELVQWTAADQCTPGPTGA